MTEIVPFRHANNGESERIAGDIFDHYREKARQCMEQREEIMTAFIAKHGFEPDEIMQVDGPNGWTVVRLDENERKIITRQVFTAMISRQPLTRWQKFCLLLSGA